MSDMQQNTAMGRSIEHDSFAIIDREVGPHSYHKQQWPLVRRAIHTSGDFEFARLFRFSAEAVSAGIKALKCGASIIADVNMISAGLNTSRLAHYNNRCHCLINDADVIARAKQNGTTRAVTAMQSAHTQGLIDGGIIAIGNAPTALLELLRLVRDEQARPALVIGIPVGFVKAAESKDALAKQTQAPFITSLGRKGGSPLVVSSIHALLALAIEENR